MKQLKTMHRLAAIVTAGVLVSESVSASATTANFTNVTSNIVTSASTLPNLISTVAYIGGVGMGVAGVFKLKNHVDNPGQVPMKDGLVRLGAGGGLLTLPYLTKVMQGTIGDGGATGGASAKEVGFSAIAY